jgi:hypothetical protein
MGRNYTCCALMCRHSVGFMKKNEAETSEVLPSMQTLLIRMVLQTKVWRESSA